MNADNDEKMSSGLLDELRVMMQIREVIGDSAGRLMQDEVVERIRKLQELESLRRTWKSSLRDADDRIAELEAELRDAASTVKRLQNQRKEWQNYGARVSDSAEKLCHYIKEARSGDRPLIQAHLVMSIDLAVLEVEKAIGSLGRDTALPEPTEVGTPTVSPPKVDDPGLMPTPGVAAVPEGGFGGGRK